MELFDPVHGSSDPDRYWTLTNAAEATPDILSPGTFRGETCGTRDRRPCCRVGVDAISTLPPGRVPHVRLVVMTGVNAWRRT
jgi:hypothetical protein